MKDIYKNPAFYYILVPVVMAGWPLLVWGLYLPDANEMLDKEMQYSQDGRREGLAILKLDPDRLNFADLNDTTAEFSYAVAIDKVAGLCNIPASRYKFSTGPIIKKSKQKSQNAHVKLDRVSVMQFAKFLSVMQLRWGTLLCEKMKLTKVEGLPDVWTVDIDFKYFF